MIKSKGYNAALDKFITSDGKEFETLKELKDYVKSANKGLFDTPKTAPIVDEIRAPEFEPLPNLNAVPEPEPLPNLNAVPEPEPLPNLNTVPESEPINGGLDNLFAEFAKPTIQDKEKTLGDKAVDALESAEDLDVLEEVSEESRKQSAKLNSLLIVECVDILINLLCKFITDDFSKENDQRFSISEPKKTAIKKPLYLILLQKQKQVNPVWGLVGAISLSYLPLIIVAVTTRMNKKKAERLAAQNEVFNDAQRNVLINDYNNAVNSLNQRPVNIPIEKIQVPTVAVKKDGRGRPKGSKNKK